MNADVRSFVNPQAEAQFEHRARRYWNVAMFATAASIVSMFWLIAAADAACPRMLITLGLVKDAALFLWGWRLMSSMPQGGEPGDFDDEEDDRWEIGMDEDEMRPLGDNIA